MRIVLDGIQEHGSIGKTGSNQSAALALAKSRTCSITQFRESPAQPTVGRQTTLTDRLAALGKSGASVQKVTNREKRMSEYHARSGIAHDLTNSRAMIHIVTMDCTMPTCGFYLPVRIVPRLQLHIHKQLLTWRAQRSCTMPTLAVQLDHQPNCVDLSLDSVH